MLDNINFIGFCDCIINLKLLLEINTFILYDSLLTDISHIFFAVASQMKYIYIYIYPMEFYAMFSERIYGFNRSHYSFRKRRTLNN